MKNLIKNNDAISVVVGAILILAVLVTFMSVVTSSWVPIYEGNAESDHSDTAHRTFMDLHKQIELADETSNSATIDLGTNDISFIKNSYSVGYLEVNESSAGLFLTGNISRTDIPETSAVGIGMNVVDLNTSSPNPLEFFEFVFQQLDPASPDALDQDFIVQFRTSTSNRWITLYNIDDSNNANKNLGIIVKYNDQNVRWKSDPLKIVPQLSDPKIYTVGDKLHIDLLSSGTNLTLDEGTNQEINGTLYNSTDSDPSATLHDVIQHYMGLETGGSGYFIDYVQYNGVLDSEQKFVLNDPIGSNTSMNRSGIDSIAQFNKTKIGGGTLTLRSDYNFMVDQSYVYDGGAVFLTQEDGAVFKVDPPIVATDNSNGNLSLSFNSVILKGDYQASGNGVETLYTALSGITTINGFTDNINIVKETNPEYYGFWKSFFDDLNLSASSFATITTTPLYNETNSRLELIIVDNTSPSITVSLKTKEIVIT